MIARALQFSLLKAQECLDGLLEEWWSWWKVVVMISKSIGPYWTSWIFVNDQDCWPLLFGRLLASFVWQSFFSPSATCQVLNVLGKWVHKHSTPCVLTFSRRSGSRPVSDLSAHNKRLPRQGMAPVFPCSMLTYFTISNPLKSRPQLLTVLTTGHHWHFLRGFLFFTIRG